MTQPLESFLASVAAFSSLLALIVSVAAIAIAAYFGTYLKRKGESKAKKEDFALSLEQLLSETHATESVKSEVATAATARTEQLKAALAHKTEDLKGNVQAEISHLTQVFTPRLEAYRKLWEVSFPVRYGADDEISPEVRDALHRALTSWYYEAGNGIFLSQESTTLWLASRDMLSSCASDADIREIFSNLRASLKDDIGVYGPAPERMRRKQRQ